MDKRAKKLQEQAVKIRNELDDIETRKRRAANRKLVGKCFKFRNSYSCPQNDADYWWLFCRVLRIDKDGYPHGVSFQIDKSGKGSFEPRCWFGFDNHGYIEIDFTEYRQAQRELESAAEALFSQSGKV